MAKEDRSSERVQAERLVSLEDGAQGLTRDVSASGVYFVVDEKLEVGQQIRFSIEFSAPQDSGGVLRLNCVGKVVRVESTASKSGVAVSISESQLERIVPS